MDAINPISIEDKIEYGGFIYRKWHRESRDFNYYYSTPKRNKDPDDAKTGVNLGEARDSIPFNGFDAGIYHTHGAYTNPDGTPATKNDVMGSDSFSGADEASLRHYAGGKKRYRSYLGTPSGDYLVQYYRRPENGKDSGVSDVSYPITFHRAPRPEEQPGAVNMWDFN